MQTRTLPALGYRCLSALNILVFMGAIWVAASSAAAQGSPTLQSKAANVEALVSKAGRPEGVRVIITLTGATSGPDTLPLPSTSVDAPPARYDDGPLHDGQSATVEQMRVIAKHIGNDVSKRRRASPRLIRDAPYIAMTVNIDELEALAADPDIIRIHEDGEGEADLQDTFPLIGMPAATGFPFFARGAGTRIVVIDTGVEFNHIFLRPRVTDSACFSTSDTGPSPQFATLCPNGNNTMFGDQAGINCALPGCDHGTHVAGIAAGRRFSGTPRFGVASRSLIMSIQVFRRRISNNGLAWHDSDLLAALNQIRAMYDGGQTNIVAVNFSGSDHTVAHLVTGRNCDALARAMPFKRVIDDLRARGIATVMTSGNLSSTDQIAFPGCVSSVITVSATTENDRVLVNANMSDAVDLLAPGDRVTSSVNPTPNFGVFSGTSQAAPHVAGAFAAIRSACRDVPPPIVDRIEDELIATGIAITDHRAGGRHTRTRIQVDRAVHGLVTTYPLDCTTISPSSMPTSVRARGIIEASQLLLIN